MKTQEKQYNKREEKKDEERLVRILSKDIEGNLGVYSGLTTIRGISWAISNAICHTLGIDKKRKIGSLNEEEVKRISEFIKSPKVPKFILNRRDDFETGESKHLVGADLEMRKEFDIKRLKKIKSYRGLRHNLGLPVRGQRTRSHFRKNRRKGTGIKKKPKIENRGGNYEKKA